MPRRPTQHVLKAGTQSTSDPFTFILSDETEDRVGDVIRAKGWDLTDFKKNPIALFGHDNDFVIGTWTNVKVVGKQLRGTLELAQQGTSARIDEIRGLIAQGILKAVSVGFRIKEYEPFDKADPWGGWDILKSELMETSVVSVPANPNALALAKSLGVSKDTLKIVFGKEGVSATKLAATKGVTASNPTQKRKVGTMNTIADKIKDGETRLEALKDEVKSINDNADTEGRDLLSDETDLIEEYASQADALSKSITGWKRTEQLMGQRAADAAHTKATPTHAGAKAKAKNDKPGDLFAKMAIATLQGERERKSAIQVAEERFGTTDDRVKALLQVVAKTATSVADTTTDGWAEQLAMNETGAFIQALTGNSIYAALSAMGTAIPFGNAASLTMPYRSGTGNVAGAFVQENGTIPVMQDHLTSKTFNRFKLAVITAMSNEVIDLSQPGILEIVRRAIMDDTAKTIDTHAISTMVGVAGVRPPGLLNGAANQAATTPAGDALNEILTDLRYLRSIIQNANAGRAMAYLMHPTNADALGLVTNASGAFVFPTINGDNDTSTLVGTRVITSTHMDPTIVALTDAADWATAFGNPSFEMSQSTSLVMINNDGTDPSMYHSTTDTPGVDVAGSVHPSDAALVTGGPAEVRSMFQTNASALRLILPISYGVLRAGTTAYITGVAW